MSLDLEGFRVFCYFLIFVLNFYDFISCFWIYFDVFIVFVVLVLCRFIFLILVFAWLYKVRCFSVF